MNAMKPLLAVMILCLFTGCKAVYSTKPIGEAPATLNSTEWDGTWIHKDGTMMIKVMDPEKGIAQVAWIEDSKERMKLQSLKVCLLESSEWMFASFKDEDADEAEETEEKNDKDKFLWGRIEKEKDQIIFWGPSAEKFKALVEDGTLPGTVDDDDNVTLGELTPEHLKLIASEDKGVLFEWEHPLVLFRITE